MNQSSVQEKQHALPLLAIFSEISRADAPVRTCLCVCVDGIGRRTSETESKCVCTAAFWFAKISNLGSTLIQFVLRGYKQEI